MLKIFYILPFFFLVDAENKQTSLSRKLQPRIWGGTVTHIGAFPFYVGLEMLHNNDSCGGTLISRSFVLTAAHCPIEVNRYGRWKPARQVVVHLGKSKSVQFSSDPLNSSYSLIVNERDSIILHPLFDYGTLDHDIALIKLPIKATLNPYYIQLAYLPFQNETRGFTVGQQLFSPGMGLLGDDKKKKPTKLQYIETQIVPENECIHRTDNYFNNDFNICVNAANGSICKGDFGGPNFILGERGVILIGISSHLTIPFSKNWYNAKVSCEAGLPQVLIRVSYYLPWIHNHTGIPIY